VTNTLAYKSNRLIRANALVHYTVLLVYQLHTSSQHYPQCHIFYCYVECLYAECHGAYCCLTRIISLNTVMPSVVMLNIVKLCVVAPLMIPSPGNTKWGSITEPLISCLTKLSVFIQLIPNQSNRRSMIQWYFPLQYSLPSLIRPLSAHTVCSYFWYHNQLK